jgi:hypothetical protein
VLVKELTAQTLAEYARYSLGAEEYESLPNKGEVDIALEAAKAFISNKAGIKFEETDGADLAAAVLVLGAEMLDNRQMTTQYSTQNPMVVQIVNLYSSNLLPRGDDIDN